MNSDKLNIIWQQISQKLVSLYGESVFNNWLKPLQVSHFDSGSLYVKSPSKFIKNWVNNNYKSQLDSFANISDSAIITVEIIHENSLANSAPTKDKNQENIASRGAETIAQPQQQSLNLGPEFASSSNKNLTFANFALSDCNNLAHRVVSEVKQNNFNPIVICGGVGRGKTHLLNALANQEIAQNNFKNVIFLSSEKFMFLYVKSLRQNKIIEFKEYIRSADLLLIDDIKFFSGKQNVSEEFLHSFDSIIASGGKVIVTSDRAPNKHEKLDDRLKNRLSAGICVEINCPDKNLKCKIIKEKLAGQDISADSIDYLAENIHGSVRDLEGVINRITAQSYILSHAINNEFLTNFFNDNKYLMPRKTLDINGIKEIVSERFEIKVEDLDSAKKSRNISRPRQVAMFLCKKLTMKSYVDIANNFGGKDHSTVINAVKSVEKLSRSDKDFSNIISEIESSLS